ncbi:hypothetical protein LDENG_00251440, partial [Lucifuga dentata]
PDRAEDSGIGPRRWKPGGAEDSGGRPRRWKPGRVGIGRLKQIRSDKAGGPGETGYSGGPSEYRESHMREIGNEGTAELVNALGSKFMAPCNKPHRTDDSKGWSRPRSPGWTGSSDDRSEPRISGSSDSGLEQRNSGSTNGRSEPRRTGDSDGWSEGRRTGGKSEYRGPGSANISG